MIRRRLPGVALAVALVPLTAAGRPSEGRDADQPPAVQQPAPTEADGCDDLDELVEGDPDCDIERAKTTRPKPTVKRDTKPKSTPRPKAKRN